MFKSWLLFFGVLALHTLVLDQILQHASPPVQRVSIKPVMVNLITLPPPPVVKSPPPLSPVVKPAEKSPSGVAKSHFKRESVAKQRPQVAVAMAVTEVKVRTAVKTNLPLKPVKKELPSVKNTKKLEKNSPVSETSVAPSIKVTKAVSKPVSPHTRNTSATPVSKPGKPLMKVTESLPKDVTTVPKVNLNVNKVNLNVNKVNSNVNRESLEKVADHAMSPGSNTQTSMIAPPTPRPGNSVPQVAGVIKGEERLWEKKGQGSITIAPSYDAAYLRNPSPAYPAWSLRRGEEGKVWLRVQVTPTGAAAVVQIKESSGYSRLDEAAKETVMQWRFIPARKDGVAVTDWVVVPVVFKLNQ